MIGFDLLCVECQVRGYNGLKSSKGFSTRQQERIKATSCQLSWLVLNKNAKKTVTQSCKNLQTEAI